VSVSFWALALGPYRRLPSVKRSIGETLPDNALQRKIGPHDVVYAQLDPIAISEIELRKVTMQMLFLAMLVNAFHATLENRVTPDLNT
jgi:hypothetical protein